LACCQSGQPCSSGCCSGGTCVEGLSFDACGLTGGSCAVCNSGPCVNGVCTV
jgi:hypothetical protein